MDSTRRRQSRQRARGRRACDGTRSGARNSEDGGLVVRTAVRATIAAGSCIAQDMRDRDGLTRPMLRRVAQRLTASRQAPLRMLGAAYLRGDPPGADEPGPAGALVTGALEGIQGEVIDVDPRTVVEDGEAPVV